MIRELIDWPAMGRAGGIATPKWFSDHMSLYALFPGYRISGLPVVRRGREMVRVCAMLRPQ